MISNAEIMAKVEEARQRPDCFELAVVAVESRSPTNAANKAERRGLSSEDIMYARWIRIYLEKQLGLPSVSLLRWFFLSENHQEKSLNLGEQEMTTQTAEKSPSLFDISERLNEILFEIRKELIESQREDENGRRARVLRESIEFSDVFERFLKPVMAVEGVFIHEYGKVGFIVEWKNQGTEEHCSLTVDLFTHHCTMHMVKPGESDAKSFNFPGTQHLSVNQNDVQGGKNLAALDINGEHYEFKLSFHGNYIYIRIK